MCITFILTKLQCVPTQRSGTFLQADDVGAFVSLATRAGHSSDQALALLLQASFCVANQ